MRCVDVTELVTEYVEGRMPLGERLRFQLHLGACGHCRAYLAQMRQTVRALERVAPAPMPQDVRAELERRFRDWSRTKPSDGEAE
ncbi:MAG: zf-HC2 domain-containing protein [bacterium]